MLSAQLFKQVRERHRGRGSMGYFSFELILNDLRIMVQGYDDKQPPMWPGRVRIFDQGSAPNYELLAQEYFDTEEDAIAYGKAYLVLKQEEIDAAAEREMTEEG